MSRCATRLALWVIAMSLAASAAPGAVEPDTVEAAALRALAGMTDSGDATTAISFTPQEARFVRLALVRSQHGPPCLDELEVYGPDSATNLALSARGAIARASSVIPGYPTIHAVAHLNDGRFGNEHSWIPAAENGAWAEIELPAPCRVSRVVFARDRTGKFTDRQVLEADLSISRDGRTWQMVASLKRSIARSASLVFPAAELKSRTWDGVIDYAFLRERDSWSRMDAKDYLSPLLIDRPAAAGGPPYWQRLARLAPVERALVQFDGLIERLAAQGLDVEAERRELADLRVRAGAPGQDDALYLAARHAKRRLFFRDPRLAPLERVLFAKRHPLKPSHNYSDHFDSLFAPGGGLCVLHMPRDTEGRLEPARGRVETLFDGSAGIVRDPVAGFDGRTLYFAYRPEQPEVKGWQSYWHLWSVGSDGSGSRQLTEGPYHDFDPVPLPDGGLGFMSTRCTTRFLCWRPQAYVLHRMEADGSGIRRLSHANLSEWDPAVMQDGRVLWTRSEYLDKGADFGHTLWAIRPDGMHPELIFGNNTPYGYGHAREMPGSRELVCTLISHGDHQGPIALIDPARGPYDTAAITSITPDTRPQYQMGRSYTETFRDPQPVSADHILVSHNPGQRDHWALYVIDRYGNRELLYLDPAISSKSPSPLRARPVPPRFPDTHDPELAKRGLGLFTVENVYEGLGASVPRGRARYLQVAQEVPPQLETLPCGEFRSDHPSFQDFYATPVHLVHGPAHSFTARTASAVQPHAFRAGSAAAATGGALTVTERGGWPSYVAKAVLGTVRIADDGSATFTAPAGRVLYFQLLDGDFNELQRMRSVVQLQPGERRSCVGCHDDRTAAPARSVRAATAQRIQTLQAPPWGDGPFDFERTVQPVLDAQCIRCHDGRKDAKIDLRGTRDAQRVPTSYRALIAGGWVDHFDMVYGQRHFKAEPLSFGTLRSRLFPVLADRNHVTVQLKSDELRAIKAWIDLNAPLWPDYRYRPDR